MEKSRLQKLVLKYTSGYINRSELTELFEYVAANGDSPEMQSLLEELLETTIPDDRLQLDAQSLYQRITQTYESTQQRKPPFRTSWWTYGAAAALLVAFSVWLFNRLLSGGDASEAVEIRTVTTAPTDKPLLRLADGRTIYLDSVSNGVLASEDGMQIRFQDDAIYYVDTSETNKSGNEPLENTIITPKGRQYQVVLPDGSRLWLNAASMVRYPVRFDSGQREISISGEVYLEVERAKDWPFVVHTEAQRIEVLGTKFNISAYPDDLTTKTTLVEGRLRVSLAGGSDDDVQRSLVLSPGQQVVSSDGDVFLRMNRVDPEEIVSWKDNLFVFSNEEISEVMKKVSRWYDVEVEYKDGMAGKRIGGDIPRFGNIRDLMEALEFTGLLRYEQKGGVIVIMK